MSMRKADVSAAIDTLDPVLAHDPPHLWRPVCEKLRDDLRRGQALRMRIHYSILALLAVTFLIVEGPKFGALQWSLAALGAVAAAMAFVTRGRINFVGRVLAGIVFVALPLLSSAPGYWGGLVSFLPLIAIVTVPLFYPVMERESRITALLRYFGLEPQVEANEDPPIWKATA